MGAARLLIPLVLCAASLPVWCAVEKDLITSLPGFSDAQLPTKQYSGYLSPPSSTTKMFHYWFVESENDPQRDPVVLWLNGGPGCSSLAGYFDELGPLHFDRSGGGGDPPPPPSLITNPYSWNKIANILFLESPAGVGFSYSTNPVDDYKIDDNQTAFDNYGVLTSFFTAYPEYKKNDFFIAGESYAGIYVPSLVHTIMIMNQKMSEQNFINLKGFMVGNGCIGKSVGSCGHSTSLNIHMKFYNDHALISDDLYGKMVSECKDFSNMSISCADLVNEASQSIGFVNIYNIYEPCINTLPPVSDRTPRMRNPLKEVHLARHAGEPYYGPDECIDDSLEHQYFDSPEVREAIHVESMSVTGTWRICTSKIRYMSTIDSLLPIYPTLIKNYRALIFNGDVDGCVPYIGDEMWTSGLNFPVKEAWRSWSVDYQVAGYITTYDWNDFKFVTVKGSGHMVPQYRPKQAFAMFEKFIKNMSF